LEENQWRDLTALGFFHHSEVQNIRGSFSLCLIIGLVNITQEQKKKPLTKRNAMKRIGSRITVVMAALLWLASVGESKAADISALPPSEASAFQPIGDPFAKSLEKPPAQYNKASGILGMEVRNQKNEQLGRIKDVVFDLRTERVTYALLGVQGSEKLVVVPLTAFFPSPDGKELILRADKTKLASAKGVDPNDLPSPINRAWGAPESGWTGSPPAWASSSVPRRAWLPKQR
jgi:sporulation protein YlmC with PRC-barrel domain